MNEVEQIAEADFRRYIAEFNSGHFEGFGRFYAPDVHFQGQGGEFKSRDDVLSFYRQVRSRVRETLTIRSLIVGNQDIVADLETELHALADWPDFPTGVLRNGETRRSENFVWYNHAGGRFERIRSARYRGIDGTPDESSAAGDGPDGLDWQQDPSMTVERFSAYIDAFNRGDQATYGDYYDDDVVLVIAGKTRLRGRQAIFDFYDSVRSGTRRMIQINRFVAAPRRFAVELESEFVALQDLPDFTAGPLRKGGRIFINTVVLYDVRAGKFARIRSAPLRKIARP
jgi:hypothetical protein